MPPSPPLKSLLLVLVVYFLAMSAAHFFGLKFPLLFVYYDTPYYAYQDRIISFTLVSYALLFHAASRNRSLLPYVLISVWTTVAGLAAINRSGELALVLEGQGTGAYWLQTALYGGIAAVLTLLYIRERTAK
jgi:hypothetical protein